MTLNGDSKSAGRQAWLITSDMKIYILYREGLMDINDDYFEEFDRLDVILEGEVQNEKWLEVKFIKNEEFTEIENDIK